MIELLYTVIGAQMALILTLIFKTPLRKLLIMGLDKLKRGTGPVMVKTVAMIVFVVLLFSVYSMSKIRDRTIEAGIVDPTEEVLMAKHMLEASLMGFMLFLSLMIDRIHHYVRELPLLRKTIEAVKMQNRGNEDGKNGAEELKALREEIATLRAKIKKLESECGTNAEDAKAAEAIAEALRKQSEGLLKEYDHLLEENQNLWTQLQSIEQILSNSDGKKNIVHHYIRDLQLLRKTIKAVRKKNRDNKNGKNGAEQLKALGEETATLRTKVKKLESECGTKAEEAKAAEAKAEALRKQSEGLLMEYDHLLEENQNLGTQLQSIEQSLSNSDGKKETCEVAIT